MKKNKVSFDFDSTLDKPTIQELAKELVEEGFEVWIVTTRHADWVMKNPNYNDDLRIVAKDVGIDEKHIHFTNHEDKWPFLKDKGFIFHIDDDWHELRMIQKHVKGTYAISSFGNPHWKHKCRKAIKKSLAK